MLYRLQTLLDSPEVIWSSVALVAIVVLAFWMLRQPRSFKAFDAEGGGVIVTRKAVRELVQRCCSDLHGVGSAKADVRVRSGEVSVRVALRTRRSANLKGISGHLREEIRVALMENLGIQNVGDVEIRVVGILDDSGKDE